MDRWVVRAEARDPRLGVRPVLQSVLQSVLRTVEARVWERSVSGRPGELRPAPAQVLALQKSRGRSSSSAR